MGYHITKADIDYVRTLLKSHEPYDKDDPVLNQYDGEYDTERLESTMMRDWLERIGLDPYDDNDYGEYTN